MSIGIKAWFKDTKNDFKEFAIRQQSVLIGLVVLYVSIYVASHFFVLYSDAYTLTEEFIKNDHTVESVIGKPESIHLEPFANSIYRKNSDGWAELELNASGPKGHFKVRSYSERKDGEWRLLKVHALLPNYDVIPLKK